MSASRHAFKLNNATRLIKAAKAAGCAVRGVTMDDGGTVTVLVDDAAVPEAKRNPLDRVLKDDQDQKRLT